VRGTSSDGNKLLALPQGWVLTDLGAIVHPSNEKLIPSEYLGSTYVGLEHIEKDSGKLLGFGTPNDVKSTKSTFHQGDLLYGKLRPNLNKVWLSDREGICSTDIFVLSKNPWISNKFLCYRLLSRDFVLFANQQVSGIELPRVNINKISPFPILLPPLPEQYRIATKIEELLTQLDAGVTSLKKVQVQLKRYRQAVLKAAFEGRLTQEWRGEHKGKINREVIKMPHGWVETTIDQIGIVNSGNTPPNLNESFETGEIPFFRVGDMNRQGNEIYMNVSKISINHEYIKKTKLKIHPAGTIIFPKRGGAIATNKKRILIRPSCIDLNIMGVTPKIIPYKFLYYWFLQINLATLSDGSNVPQINHDDIKPLQISLPVGYEQMLIIAEIERLFSIADEVEHTIERSLKQSETLRQSILKQAFEGKLVPQDPTDEPASVLLERIKAEKVKTRTNMNKGKRVRNPIEIRNKS
jgi:type I restriction enzyme S subunit